MRSTSDTLFYDGQCSLCAHEIALLRKLKRPGLRLVDVHQADESWLNELGTSKIQMLQVLHLLSHDGKFLLGLDATVKAWSYTAFGWLFSVLRWSPIKPLADHIYQRWAERRSCRLGYDVCTIKYPTKK